MFRRTSWRVLAGVLLAFAVGELWNRQVTRVHWAWDPDLGEILEPGSRFVRGGEGRGSGVISEHGTRRWVCLPGSPLSRPHVLVLGDSFAEGLQVSDEALFSNVTGRLLQEDGIPVRVTNAGRAAASMADFACRAETYQKLFAPDWLVVVLNEGDFHGDAFAPQRGNARFRRVGPRLECGPPALPPPPPDRGPIRAAAHALRNRLSLPDALLASLKARVAADEKGLPLFSAGRALAADEPAGSAGDETPVEEELHLLATAWGPSLTLFYLPGFSPSSLSEPEAIERRIAAFAAARGVRFRSLREEFRDLARRRTAPYGFSNTRLNAGHWNAAGHAAGARILHREFLELRASGLL